MHCRPTKIPRSRPASGSTRSTPCSRTRGSSAPTTWWAGSFGARAARARTCPTAPIPRTSTRSRRATPAERSPGNAVSSTASARSSAGTRWRWSSRPTARTPRSAGTSRASPRRRRSTTSASTTSSTRRATTSHGGDLDLHPGPLGAGHLRAGVPRGPHQRGAAATASGRRSTAAGLSSYPHPRLMPDFWQFPTGVDGARPAHGDLPGALHEVPAGPRHPARPRAARSGPSSATARPTSPSPGRHLAGRPARSSTT